MPFGLLVPAFLAGLVAIAAPIILHLRHREQDRPQDFPSLMFLERLPIRTWERRRVTDLPLLLMRVAALALLTLAFARPLFQRPSNSATSARARAVIVALDRSMSMGRTGVWTAATDSARRMVASLAPADRAALVLFDDEAELAQAFTADHQSLIAAIGRAQPSARGTRFAAALREARQLASRVHDAAPELVVITDLQRSGSAGIAGTEMPANLKIRTVAVGAADHGNISVASVAVQRLTSGQRTMLSVQARLRSRANRSPRNVSARLVLNGRESGARVVAVPANGDTAVVFDSVLMPGGQVRAAIAIDHDALAADDSFHFALKADDAVRLLLVVPDDVADEALFFERALAVGRTPIARIDRIGVGQLSPRVLQGEDAVLLWDVRPAQSASASLKAWVEQGGGLIAMAGQRTATRSQRSALIAADVIGNIERLGDRGGSLGDVRVEHPVFAPFRTASASLNDARFLRYARLEPAAGADVIARFDDGTPAVIERRQGAGRVVVTAFGFESRASDFPLQAAYLPFIHRLVLHSAGRDPTALWRTTADSWVLPRAMKEPVVLTPRGSIVRLKPDSSGASTALRETGIYAAYDGRVQGEPLALIAVNSPAAESELAPMDARDLLLGVREAKIATADASEVPTTAEIEGRQRLWRLVLIAAALLLLTETVVAGRGWRGVGSSAT